MKKLQIHNMSLLIDKEKIVIFTLELNSEKYILYYPQYHKEIYYNNE